MRLPCTNIPFAVTKAELLAELGWNIWDNENYENSSVVKIDGEIMRGYKLGILRGVLDDSGIAEEIVFGTLKTHDMEQCREMLRTTACLHENDILINDREFLSREMANYLKTVHKVDTYLPAK